MIQGVQKAGIIAYLNLLEDRINLNVPKENLRYLFKITNDMNKAEFYSYAIHTFYAERYGKCSFNYNTNPNIFNGDLKLQPAGYYKYEVYEVAWDQGCTVELSSNYAPVNETQVLSDPCAGVVQGLIAIGKLYLSEKEGEEQVQYVQRVAPTTTNYIYYGQ